MNELDVSFLGETGEDRAEVREVLGAAGFEVSEHPVPGRREQGPEPEEPGPAPVFQDRWPELLQLLIFAQAHWKDAALLLGLLNGLITLYDRFRASNREAEIEVRFETRIYTVVTYAPDGADKLRGIAADVRDGDPARTGYMTWQDSRWRTVEELNDPPDQGSASFERT